MGRDKPQSDKPKGQDTPDDGVPDLRSLAVSALADVLQDTTAPAAARAQASRTALEYLGEIGRHAAPPKRPGDGVPVEDLSPAQIDARIAELESELNGQDVDPFG